MQVISFHLSPGLCGDFSWSHSGDDDFLRCQYPVENRILAPMEVSFLIVILAALAKWSERRLLYQKVLVIAFLVIFSWFWSVKADIQLIFLGKMGRDTPVYPGKTQKPLNISEIYQPKKSFIRIKILGFSCNGSEFVPCSLSNGSSDIKTTRQL